MTTINTLFKVPCYTLAISGTATASAPVGLPSTGGSIRLFNEGPNICFVAIGPTGQSATVPTATGKDTCVPVAAGEDLVFGVTGDVRNTISIICRSAGTCTLLVSTSEGV